MNGGNLAIRDVRLFSNPGPPIELRVEYYGADGDGGVLVGIFCGPGAEQHAERFAERLRSGEE